MSPSSSRDSLGADPASDSPDHAVGPLVDALVEASGSKEDFLSLLAAQPQILGYDVEAQLVNMGRMPGFGTTFQAFAALVRDARTDPGRAWATFHTKMAAAEALGEELEKADAQITAALDEGRRVDALSLVRDSIEKATRAGLGIVVADLHLRAGEILIGGGISERDQEVETAIADFEAGLQSAVAPEQRAALLMNLGRAGPERVRGDRRENVEEGIELLGAALDALGDQEPGELDALIRTNLASVLLARETDDRVGNLMEARQLVERALELRSPDRDPIDCAYSQLNLGLILDRLAQEDVVGPGDAVAAWQDVVHEADRCPSWLVGHAHHGIGQHLAARAEPRLQRLAADAGEGDEVVEVERLEDEDFEPDPELLKQACDHLRRARTLLVNAPDQLARGRALNDLAGVLTSLQEVDEAIVVGGEALNVLGPTTSPRDCLMIAGRLGSQLADRNEWEDAAEVFRAGVLAAEIAIDTRLHTPDRRREAQRGGNIARWASFCLARVGEPLDAVLVLENGRTREVRRRLGSVAAGEHDLGDLPDELRQAYQTALASLAAAGLDGSETNASRALQEVLYEIREQPGFESFGAGTDEQGLMQALEPNWPLLYVNPTPWGTLLLLVGAEGGRPAVTSRFLSPTSTEVFLRLMAGNAAETMDLDEDSDVRSYLFGISTDHADYDLREDLEQALPWLGEHLGRPIAQLLAAEDAGGVTLVLCGPLGAAPLHAAPWRAGSGERCLLDEVDIRHSPSAVLAATAIARVSVAEALEPRLLALANPGPDPNLAAAVPEAREIAQFFAEDRRLIYEGADATSATLLEHAGHATHIHFACHANGGLFASQESAVVLADRDVTALELTALVGLETRLVAVSACRSAMAEITEMADEVMSFGTAVLAAGSACAIATLWPVNDTAAAFLMIKTYEELQQPGRTPPEALRRAQLWLRDLSPEAEYQFLSTHPALDAEVQRRAAAGDISQRGGSKASSGRFSHPVYWAPFIASGA